MRSLLRGLPSSTTSISILALLAFVPAIVAACGDTSGSSFKSGGGNGTDGGFPPTDSFGDVLDGGGEGPEVFIESMRIEPPDATITVNAGEVATQDYKVFVRLKGIASEQDITSRTVFYVPDNYLIGAFPSDGKSTFSTRLPATDADPPQRGGKLTVRALAANSDGTTSTTETSLTVKIAPTTLTQPGAAPALPANPADLFKGTPSAGRAPKIVYPNDGVMMPPNLRRLDVHFDKGTGNDLFELRFVGPYSDVTYFARCTGGSAFVAGACGFELDQRAYAFIAATNGGGTVKLKMRGTDSTGATYGESSEIAIHVAESDVNGGLYYWTTSPDLSQPERARIMRVDFGNPNSTPEEFLVPGEDGLTRECVGCHAISRDGKKLVASLGGQWDGRLVYLNDLSKQKGENGWLVQNGAETGAPAKNRVQFASFNPTGSQFVAVWGDLGNAGKDWHPGDSGNFPLPVGSEAPTDIDAKKLWLHDGETGLRLSSKTLSFKPVHPDWSPDGTKIAVTHVGDNDTTTQRPRDSWIEVLPVTGGSTIGDPFRVVAPASGKNRYNPNFAPDTSFLYYSESDCTGPYDPAKDQSTSGCDGDADQSAKTWAVKPAVGGDPVLLANANKAGISDGANTHLGDTFPRSTPFKTKQGSGQLFWVTIASRREPGRRTHGGAQLLWMFAVDPAQILAGKDGSYPAFFLPFQEFATSNHIGQWTEKVVGSTAPPPPPPPPLPPNPPLPK